MFVNIEEYFQANPTGKVRIKKAVFTDVSEEESRATRKAHKYFSYLQEIGLLGNHRLDGRIVHQDLRPSSNCFLGISPLGGASEKLGGRFLISSTSTERSLHAALRKAGPEVSAENVETATGMCLFGLGSDIAHTESQDQISVVRIAGSEESSAEVVQRYGWIDDITCREEFSLYELEKLLRTTAFLRQLRPHGHGVTSLNTPRVQYLLYLLPLYKMGAISAELLLRWHGHVVLREERIRAAFQALMPNDVRLMRSPLEHIESHLLDRLRQGRQPGLHETVSILRDSGTIWNAVVETQQPARWRDLIYLSYVVSLLEMAQEARDAGRVLFQVDDQVERVTLSETARIQRALRKVGRESIPIIGLYHVQNTVDTDGSVDSDFYYRDEGPAEIRAIVERYLDPEGERDLQSLFAEPQPKAGVPSCSLSAL